MSCDAPVALGAAIRHVTKRTWAPGVWGAGRGAPGVEAPGSVARVAWRGMGCVPWCEANMVGRVWRGVVGSGYCACARSH